MYWCDDTKNRREYLTIGMVLVLTSIILICIWSIVYILVLYKHDVVYYGYGPPMSENSNGDLRSNYMDEEKSGFIIVEILWVLI